MKYQVSQPLKLKGTANTRDLGGYLAGNGQAVKTKAFLRSDGLFRLTAEDKQMLYDYGVRYVIDLRSGFEAKRDTYVLPETIKYQQHSLLDHINSNEEATGFPGTMVELYKDLLDQSQNTFAGIFRSIAQCGDGTILFHCTAGKDRTGLVSMLLLKLVGVADEQVVADYAATYENLRPFLLKVLGAQGIDTKVPEHVLESKPETMRATLSYLHEQYQSSENYLRQAGLTGPEIASIKLRLLGD